MCIRDRTRTWDHIFLYETVIIIGGAFGNIMDIYEFPMPIVKNIEVLWGQAVSTAAEMCIRDRSLVGCVLIGIGTLVMVL